MAFFKLMNMEPCEEPFITCDNAYLGVEQIFRALLVDIDGKPGIRTCSVSSADSGINVQHFVATAGQTIFTVTNPIVNDYMLSKDGAIKQTGHNKTGPSEITMPAQLVGTEITIMY